MHPLAMILIYTIVFSQVMKAKLGDQGAQLGSYAFTIYLCAGLLPWNAFLEVVNRGTGIFHEYATLIKKVSFPIEILHTVVCGSSLVTWLISMFFFGVLLLITGHGVTWAVLWLPVFLLLQMLLGTGMALILGAFNVFFRDIQQFVNIFFQVWFWATPIVYLKDYVPENLQWVFYANPFYYFVDLYQSVLFFQRPVNTSYLAIAAVISVSVYALGCGFFVRIKNDITDEI